MNTHEHTYTCIHAPAHAHTHSSVNLSLIISENILFNINNHIIDINMSRAMCFKSFLTQKTRSTGQRRYAAINRRWPDGDVLSWPKQLTNQLILIKRYYIT